MRDVLRGSTRVAEPELRAVMSDFRASPIATAYRLRSIVLIHSDTAMELASACG